jgi:hypothetical protein
MSDPLDPQSLLNYRRGEILHFAVSKCLGSEIDITKLSFSSLEDGEMGSFVAKENHKILFNFENKNMFCRAKYLDDDGIDVYIDFYNIGDKYFEIDFWKVDFSNLIIFPNSNMIHDIECVK